MIQRQTKSILRAAAAVLLSFGLAAGGVRPQTRPRVTGQTPAAPQSASVRLKTTLAGHKKKITDIYFSPDGETLATVGQDATIRLWNVGTGETKAVLSIRKKYRLGRLLWSPDGLRLAACANRGWSGTAEVRVWDARTGELKVTFDPHHASIMTGFEWSPDGRLLLTANEDGTVKLWDTETGRLSQNLAQEPWKSDETDSILKSIFTFKKFADLRSTQAHFDAGGRTVLTLSDNSPPKLWDAASGKVKTTVLLTETRSGAPYYFVPHNALVSPDRSLIVRYDNAGVTFLDASTGEPRRELANAGDPTAFSPDGHTLLVIVRGAQADTLRLYDVETGRLRLTFENVPKGIRNIYWSPDGSRILAVGWRETNPLVLDTRTGRVTARLPYSGCDMESLWGNGLCADFIFSADGRVVFKQKNPLKLWSAETGELLATLEEANEPAEFSPTDKRLLVTRGKDKRTALLWELSLK